jgi:hypothetical protein
MRMPNLPFAKDAKVKKSTITWAGLDRRSLIAENSFSDTTNLSTKNFPLISPRDPREAAYTLTAGWALFASSKLVWVDGTSFLYDGVSKGTVTASAKSMVELSQRIVIFPDKKSYDTVGNTFAAFGSGNWYATPIPAGSVPDIQYACTLDNRIWGVDNKDNICCTALGDFDDWTSFLNPDGSVNDAGAWSVDTGTNGGFTGIVSYKGYNLVFKLDRVFRRFGEVPSNFQYVEISRLGCVSHKSIWEVNGILFWLSPQGVVAFTGGVPEIIGEELNDSYVSAVAGGDDRRYYISLYDGSAYKLYVYDTWKKEWLQEDNLSVRDFAYFGGSLYALAADNKVWKFNSGSEVVSSSFTTKEYTEEIGNKKGYSDLLFRVDLEAGSSMNVYTKIDNGSFSLVKSYSASDLTTVKIPLKITDADHFTIKCAMTGEYRIYQTQRDFNVEGD